MQPYLLAALFVLRAVALPQSADEQPSTELSGVVVEDGVELDSNFITEPFFEILSNYTEQLGNLSAPAEQKLAERQSPNDPATVTAEAAAKMKAPGGGKDGLFYRGDSRPPSVIFSSGFTPQGSDMSLRNHLSFAGNSGLVSLSRDPQTAQSYALGRSADKAQKGYIYVVAAKDVPNGYWVPGLYNPDKNPAVRRNQEFAVAGSVPAESISHAYEVTADKPSAKGQKIKNNAYSLTSSLSCFSKKRALCDPAKYTETTTSGKGLSTIRGLLCAAKRTTFRSQDKGQGGQVLPCQRSSRRSRGILCAIPLRARRAGSAQVVGPPHRPCRQLVRQRHGQPAGVYRWASSSRNLRQHAQAAFHLLDTRRAAVEERRRLCL